MTNLEKCSLHATVTSFLTDVDSVRSTSVFTGVMVHAMGSVASKSFKDFLDACRSERLADGQFLIPTDKLRKFRQLQRDHIRSQRANNITSRAFIVSLVSQYDAFLSALVRGLLKSQPGLIKSSNKTFNVSEILSFSSMDEAKDAIIDEEIESLLRDSHHEQFAWLERRFDIKTLRKELDSWPTFVEITQRRNLFVHSDGKVSKQYKKVCSEHGVKVVGEYEIGKQLDVDSSYVRIAADTLAEIAVKLTQVLWRKVMRNDLKAANASLTELTYGLIERKRYKLAIKLLDFSFETIKQYSSNDVRLRMLVNRANAYRLVGNKEKCTSLIQKEDWSAYGDAFILASQVLTDDFDAAQSTMKKIGAQDSPSKADYREWPLFEGFRETHHFQTAFREIFGEDVVVPQVIDPDAREGISVNASIYDFIDTLEPDEVGVEFLVDRLTNRQNGTP